MNNIHMQGDINLIPIKKAPKGEKIFEGQEYVVAYGEKTNHRHLLKVKEKETIQVIKGDDGMMYLYIGDKGILSHEEHGIHEITPGWYKIGNEREHDYFSNETRRVQD